MIFKKYDALLLGPRKSSLPSGASLIFECLVKRYKESEKASLTIDTAAGISDTAGALSIKRISANVTLLAKAFLKIPSSKSIYLIISSSRYGFIRDLIIIWLSSLFGKRIVLHLKGGGYYTFYSQQSPPFRLIIKHTLARANTIIVLGKKLMTQFRFVPKIDEKITVIPNGLTLDLDPNNKAREYSSDNSFKILYLSNLVKSKGYLDLLAACKWLKENSDFDFRCDFCGKFIQLVGDEKNFSSANQEVSFRNKINDYGLEGIVRYTPIVHGQEKHNILNEANVLVLPTSFPWEGQPVCIIEALAYSTPVIATDHKGITEQVIDGYNGCIVEYGKPEQIAKAVQTLHGDIEKYKKFQANSRKHFEENFTSEIHLRRLVSTITGPPI